MSAWFSSTVSATSSFSRPFSRFRSVTSALLASLDYLRLLWATLFGYLVFEQFPGLPTWLGAAIVIAAAVFTIYRETRCRQVLHATPAGEN